MMTGSSTTTCSEAESKYDQEQSGGTYSQNNIMTWSSDDDRVIHDDLFRGRE